MWRGLRRIIRRRIGPIGGNIRTQRRSCLSIEPLEDRNAPSASPLADINGGAFSSTPTFLNGERWFTEVGTRMFFVANTAAHGEELWMTDGTPGNTVLVRDINQGTGSSSPRFLTNVNGTLFFAANDGQTGFELWRSDGTANGTVRVADIRANGSSDPRFLVSVNNTLFFVANDGQNGFELWRSQGTAATTQMVADLNRGSNSSNPHWLLNADGTLFFAADPGGNPPGFQLFRLDSAIISNPIPVPDPDSNRWLRNPSWPVYFPELRRLFFIGEEVRDLGLLIASRMWYIDLPANNAPRRVLVVGDPSFLTAVKDPTTSNNFLFWRDGGLWVLDPASPGRGAVYLATDPFDLHNHNGVLTFSAVRAGVGREPFFVDTRGRTIDQLSAELLADINPNGSSLAPPIYFPNDFRDQPGLWDYLGRRPTWYHWQSGVFFTTLRSGESGLGKLYFAANDGVNGVELWMANETLTGVNMILTPNNNQIAPGARSSRPRFLAAGPGYLLFSAMGTDPNLGSFLGEELWVVIGPPRIVRVIPPPARVYRMREVLQFIVEMDKPTLVTGTPRLNLLLSDLDYPTLPPQNVQASYVMGSGTRQLIFRYTILRGQRDLDGIEIQGPLDLSNGMITNLFGDAGDGQFTPPSSSGVRVNGIPPWVMEVRGPASGVYSLGDLLTFRLIISEPVEVTPREGNNQIRPYLNLRIGNFSRQAFYVGGSGTTILTFRYRIQPGDHAPHGIYLDTDQPLDLGSYQITAPGTGPIRERRNLETEIRTPVFFRVAVDTRGPRITDITLPGLRNHVTGETLQFRFHFNEPVYVHSSSGARPALRLQIGPATRLANLVGGNGTNTLTFRYTIQSNDQDLDGIRLLGIQLPAGVRITDLAGNLAVLTFNHPDTRLIRVNVPTIRL
ncbi:MAG: hypothetical protein RMI91_12575 [Gemmatales bacterium]|nr:hypothetical protein [Gemmatales bacterium]MDW7995477.1 hypothetical protein [Gemmatales bacterium]